jgi:hypothetical protein
MQALQMCGAEAEAAETESNAALNLVKENAVAPTASCFAACNGGR